MSTNTFDRKLEISDPESIRNLIMLINTDVPDQPLSEHPYSNQERKRSEDLLKQFLYRSNH